MAIQGSVLYLWTVVELRAVELCEEFVINVATQATKDIDGLELLTLLSSCLAAVFKDWRGRREGERRRERGEGGREGGRKGRESCIAMLHCNAVSEHAAYLCFPSHQWL